MVCIMTEKKAFLYVEPKNDIPVVRYDGGTHANILTLLPREALSIRVVVLDATFVAYAEQFSMSK